VTIGEDTADGAYTGTETIDSTTNHPYFVVGYGFVEAGNLRPGDTILLANGENRKVDSVEIEFLDDPVTVYNFEVADWHTYFVGDTGVLVHNANIQACSDAAASAGGNGKAGNATDGASGSEASRTNWGPEHGKGNVKHNNAIETELDNAAARGATDMSKNMVQRDINGNRVYTSNGGYTKPDASYVIDGVRHNTNYVSNYKLDNVKELNREIDAFNKMIKADPDAVTRLVFQY